MQLANQNKNEPANEKQVLIRVDLLIGFGWKKERKRNREGKKKEETNETKKNYCYLFRLIQSRGRGRYPRILLRIIRREHRMS